MKYTVIALSVGGLGNKIFRSGDTVYDNNFPPGNAKSLVEQGFLKPIEEVETPKRENQNYIKVEEPVTLKAIDEFTVKELRGILGNDDPKLRKADLYKLLEDKQ